MLKSLGFSAGADNTVVVLACPSGLLTTNMEAKADSYLEGYPFALLQPSVLEESSDYSSLLSDLNRSTLKGRKRSVDDGALATKVPTSAKKQKTKSGQ